MDKYKDQSFLPYSSFFQDILCEYFQSIFLDFQLLVEFHYRSVHHSFKLSISRTHSQPIFTYQNTMASYMKALALTALLTSSAAIAAAQSGSGTTTRYWYILHPQHLHLATHLTQSPGIAANHPAPGPTSPELPPPSRPATSPTTRSQTQMRSQDVPAVTPTCAATNPHGP